MIPSCRCQPSQSQTLPAGSQGVVEGPPYWREARLLKIPQSNIQKRKKSDLNHYGEEERGDQRSSPPRSKLRWNSVLDSRYQQKNGEDSSEGELKADIVQIIRVNEQ